MRATLLEMAARSTTASVRGTPAILAHGSGPAFGIVGR
jgi:hypothetical protein